ncbi:MAG TPA: alpha-amylase family glycosyl hydrolase [Candidatus Limnocylindrales bacterium]|nr:alpha-amylase family glycosyl hydrolase [Candidatus Limnocylindrales bacterium]
MCSSLRVWHRCIMLCIPVVFGILAADLPAQTTNLFWQQQNIYQIITDRFFDGDPSNNNADGNYSATGTTSVHGGDFKGIEQKLDYIKALGATAVWISPVVLNGHGQFHGYAGRDFYKVDPHWGSLADLQHFTAAAHARGLLVIDDIICNHGDDLIYSTDSGYPAFLAPPAGYTLTYRNSSLTYAPPFDIYNSTYTPANNALTNLFHNYGGIPDYNTPAHYQLGELSGLDDFRTESPYVRSNMAAIYNFWIQQAGFDGFRIDTFKHVDTGFWQYWCPLVHQFAATNSAKPNFFMFGEVYDSSESLCGYYTGTESGGPFLLDSVLDYPLYFQVGSVFGSGSGATSLIQNHYNSVDSLYDPVSRMQLVTFLDNHDQPRFLNSSTTNRLAVALVFLYTSRGVPCLYYGTEQAFNGATDPYDREDMFAGQFKDTGLTGVDSFNMTHPLFQLVAKLNNFRRLYPAISLGSYTNQTNNSTGPGLFAYSRILNSQEVLVVLNTAGSTQTLSPCTLTYPGGTVLVNLLNTNETYTLNSSSQTPAIDVPSTSAKIFIAQSQWLPLDPVVVSNSPAHDATNVPINASIVLQFSKPMDTNSVQSAFSTAPAISGTFAWSPAHDTLSFTPGGAGLPALTTVILRITNSAVDAVSGNAMFAPYQLQFHTGSGVADVTPPTISMLTPTNGTRVSGNLPVSGTASDNVAVQKVEVELDNRIWVVAAGTTSWSLNLNSSNFLNGPHLISARATDTSSNISITNTASVWFFNAPGNYVQRISGGNPANVTDCSGNLWLMDTAYTFGAFGYSGGTTGYLNNVISGVCSSAQSLYQRERYSTSSSGFYYEFDCPEGVYETTLLEAETYWSGPGKREFNTFIQGQQVLTNFDIYAAAGGMNIPISLVFTNAVTNSQLQILFTPGAADNARVSGVQVRKIADVFSDTDGIPDWWRLAYFGHPLGMASDLSRGADDADGNGISNLTKYLNGADPLNPASGPTLPSFNLGPVTVQGSNVQVGFSPSNTWTYQLQRSDSLAPAAWVNVSQAVSGAGGTILLSDTGGATNFARFYRVHAY